MKITDRLLGDHKTFRKMLSDLGAIAGQPSTQRDDRKLVRLVELFKDHLVIHAWCEETFYYPVIRQELHRSAPPLTVAYMDHLDSEHATVDGYLDRLEQELKAQPMVGAWPQTYALFSKGLVAHMKKEEEELFPLSEQLLGSALLEEISHELERRRKDAPPVRLHTR